MGTITPVPGTISVIPGTITPLPGTISMIPGSISNFGGPSLSLDFTNPNIPLSSLITFSRASSATYFDSTGTLQTAASGVARAHAYQDYNPSTLSALGFLIEEQRTNSIRNNTMVGAVVGTPGTLPTNWAVSNAAGMTTNVIAISTENGIEYIDLQVVGSPTGTQYVLLLESTTQTTAANGQSWSLATYIKNAGGSQTNIASYSSRVRFGTAAGALVELFDTAISPAASSAQLRTSRIGGASTATNALVERVTGALIINFTSTAVATDVTLRIGLPQLELGAFATSVIKTTTGAATRLADSASIGGAAFTSFFNSSEGTLLPHHRSEGTPSLVNLVSLRKDDTGADEITLRYGSALGGSPGSIDMFIRAGSVTRMDSGGATIALSTLYKSAMAYKLSDSALVTNGGAAQTGTPAAMPTGIVELIIGGSGFCGWIPALSYYRTRLPNSSLVSLTT